MVTGALAREIESARRRLGLSKAAFARKVGLSNQALTRILGGGGVNSDTLSRLQDEGGIRVTRRLVSSLRAA